MTTESAACNCMGPQNGEPFCPCMMNRLGIFKRNDKWIEPEKVVGVVIDKTKPQMPFSQKWEKKSCTDYRHNPPMGLYIAPGETYVHVCPGCGYVRSITGSNITFSEVDDEEAFVAESDFEVESKLNRD